MVFRQYINPSFITFSVKLHSPSLILLSPHFTFVLKYHAYKKSSASKRFLTQSTLFRHKYKIMLEEKIILNNAWRRNYWSNYYWLLWIEIIMDQIIIFFSINHNLFTATPLLCYWSISSRSKTYIFFQSSY